jgi:proline-specific peptidase
MKSFITLLIFFLVILSGCSNRNDEITSEMWDEWTLHTNDGINLFIREFGNGDTIIVLHGGWGVEHSYLLDAFSNIADKYHFVFYDQRGSLRSPCSDTLISVAKHIDDVEQIRKELSIEKVVLIGHSMGGFLGMSYLEKYPENVRGLILIASPAAKSSVYDLTEGITKSALKRWERQEVLDTLSANGLELNNKNLTSKQRGLWHRITFSAINMHYIRNWRKMKGCFYFNQMANQMAGLTMPEVWDFTKIIEKVDIPITIICGNDDYLPLSWQKEWISSVPNMELKIIENAGHMVWIDQAEVFKTYILSALEKY